MSALVRFCRLGKRKVTGKPGKQTSPLEKEDTASAVGARRKVPGMATKASPLFKKRSGG